MVDWKNEPWLYYRSLSLERYTQTHTWGCIHVFRFVQFGTGWEYSISGISSLEQGFTTVGDVMNKLEEVLKSRRLV